MNWILKKNLVEKKGYFPLCKLRVIFIDVNKCQFCLDQMLFTDLNRKKKSRAY